MMNPPTRKKRTSAILRTLAHQRRGRTPASEYVRQALQSLSNLCELGALELADRKELRDVMQRLWLALRELEQGNP